MARSTLLTRHKQSIAVPRPIQTNSKTLSFILSFLSNLNGFWSCLILKPSMFVKLLHPKCLKQLKLEFELFRTLAVQRTLSMSSVVPCEETRDPESGILMKMYKNKGFGYTSTQKAHVWLQIPDLDFCTRNHRV